MYRSWKWKGSAYSAQKLTSSWPPGGRWGELLRGSSLSLRFEGPLSHQCSLHATSQAFLCLLIPSALCLNTFSGGDLTTSKADPMERLVLLDLKGNVPGALAVPPVLFLCPLELQVLQPHPDHFCVWPGHHKEGNTFPDLNTMDQAIRKGKATSPGCPLDGLGLGLRGG